MSKVTKDIWKFEWQQNIGFLPTVYNVLGPFWGLFPLICESAFDNICVCYLAIRKTLTTLYQIWVYVVLFLRFYPFWMLCDALGIKRNALKNTSKCTIFSIYGNLKMHRPVQDTFKKYLDTYIFRKSIQIQILLRIC